MPIYEYTCQECKHDFVVTLSIKETEAKPAVTCPDCKSGNVVKKYSGFTAVTSRKS
jgi:putative FmdB family regulatory protein